MDTVAGCGATPRTESSDIAGHAGIVQSTIINNLESSCAEGETLTSKVAQSEPQQKVLAETVREHVSKAVQKASFVVDRSTRPKRSAQDMEVKNVTELHTRGSKSTALVKKWDTNRKTLVEILTAIKEINKAQDTWHTPDYLEHIASRPESRNFPTPQNQDSWVVT